VSPRVIFYIGPGKGKTTAAIGLAVRAAGNNLQTRIVQFIKAQETGEVTFIQSLKSEYIQIIQTGAGFCFEKNEDHKEGAIFGISKAEDALAMPKTSILVLDEVFDALFCGLVTTQQILGLITKAKANRKHIVLTGHNAPVELFPLADVITFFTSIRHDILCDKGIEF